MPFHSATLPYFNISTFFYYKYRTYLLQAFKWHRNIDNLRVSYYLHHPPVAPDVLPWRVTTVHDVLCIFYVCINTHRSAFQKQKLKLRYAILQLATSPNTDLFPRVQVHWPPPGAVQYSAVFLYRNVTDSIF